jgi:hypothetical protein
MFDPVPYVQCLALADGVFDGIKTPEALWEQEVPPGNRLFKLRWKRGMMDEPVLRSVSTAGLVLATPLNSSTFNTLLKNAVVNAGYYERVTIHSIRRGVANSVDSMPYPFYRLHPPLTSCRQSDLPAQKGVAF